MKLEFAIAIDVKSVLIMPMLSKASSCDDISTDFKNQDIRRPVAALSPEAALRRYGRMTSEPSKENTDELH